MPGSFDITGKMSGFGFPQPDLLGFVGIGQFKSLNVATLLIQRIYAVDQGTLG